MKHFQPFLQLVLFAVMTLTVGFVQLEAQNCLDQTKINSEQVCPRLYSPVCGCDGRTYNNACEAQKSGITSTKKGKCPEGTRPLPVDKPCIDKSKVNPNQACPRVYSPVCGCDGRTYSNACEAQKSGVTRTSKGKCPKTTPPLSTQCVDESKVDLQRNCPSLYSPVCGCDYRTYNNACEAEKMGVTAMRKGECPRDIKPTLPTECIDKAKINPQQNCPSLYSPVCGCDGRTYSNVCQAQKAGVTSTKKGKCPEGTKPTTPTECIDQTKVNHNQACPKLYSPVCGCNGKTYSNRCEAEKAGVTSVKKGKCQ